MLEGLPKPLPAIVAGLLAALAVAVATPSAHAAGSAATSQAAWARVGTAAALRAPTPAKPLVAPARFAAYTLDQAALADVLAAAPDERRRTAAPAAGEGLTISVPTPDGGFERFAVVDSPVMTAGLAARRPDLRTYSGRGVDDPTATIRLDLTPLGFHASVRGGDGAWYVDPRYADRSQYVAYERGAIEHDPARSFTAGEDVEALDGATDGATPPTDGRRVGEPNGGDVQLRTYRLALVSDDTYATNSGSNGDTTAAKVVLMDRVDHIYEQELGIRMVLIADTAKLNLDTPAKYSQPNGPCGATACFTAGAECSSALISRNNTVAGLLAGAGNYDIAHLVMGIDGGGIAGVGVVGTDAKGRGCTGLRYPFGDSFAVDYVAHEIGHQFGASHTFAGGAGSCAGNAVPGVAVEPGSGSSIMAYAGICGADDLQDHSDPYFSQRSTTQISTYVTGAEGVLDDQQQAVLSGFDGTDSFALTYDGQTSTTITRTVNYTPAGLRGAIQALTGGTVTVGSVTDSGFTVSFGGALAGRRVDLLAFSGLTGATGAINETVAGGPTRKGGYTVTPTGNHVPDVTVAGPSAVTIPARTPFRLEASASDVDHDALTYMWEQDDPGTGPLLSNAKAAGPLFRVFGAAAVYASQGDAYLSPSPGENQATATPWRAFPDYAQVAADDTNAATGSCPVGDVDCFSEFLPTASYTADMHFRVSVRDNHLNGGGVGTADATVTPVWTGAPFRVTSQASPSTTVAGASLPVTWDVAGTTGNGIDTADVRITMSTDGGQTFDHVLAASTPNDGAATVTVPSVPTSHARIMVQAVGNVFFDISKRDLTIAAASPAVVTAPASADLGPATVGAAGAPVAVTFASQGTSPATTGAVALGGADAGAVGVVDDGCSSRTLPVGTSCTVTVRLTPTHAGAQSATLSLPSDDLASPATVALTGTGVAPTTPDRPRTTDTSTTPSVTTTPSTPSRTSRTATPDPQALAAALLHVADPYKLGSAGRLSLFATTRSTRLGRPRASRTIAVAACAGGTCRGAATAKLTLTPKAKGRKKVVKTIILVKDLRLADGRATRLTLKLSAKDRKAVKAARKATLTLTVTNATKKVVRTYTLTVG
jgi:hypothetical protein